VRLDGARLAALLAILALWGVSLWNLDRWPPVHQDEPWILSPGYKLFTRGVYGSDLFTGFYGMEHHYFQFMPLMSLLQGATTRVLGVGVWQMRCVPVALGMLTATLTFALARKLAGTLVAPVALLLLLTWPWTPGVGPMLGSGVPLIDVSRIARYDILTAPLGLCALWCFVRARESNRLSYDFLSGVLAGLAGLAHVYGLFWIGALFTALMLDRFFSKQSALRSVSMILMGAAAAWAIWIGYSALNWEDFAGQLFAS